MENTAKNNILDPNLDFYLLIASKYYRIPIEEVTKEQRTYIKHRVYAYFCSGTNYSQEEIIGIFEKERDLLEQKIRFIFLR